MIRVKLVTAILAASMCFSVPAGFQLPKVRIPNFEPGIEAENLNDYDITIDDSVDRTGSVDASRAISEAIERASEIGTPEQPAVVYIPEGTYLVEGGRSIIMKNNVVLRLDDKAVIKLKNNGSMNSPMLMQRSDGVTGGYGQLSNVEIYGGVWDAAQNPDKQYLDDNSTPIDITVIGFAHAENIRIHDTKVINNIGQHVLVFDGCKNVEIENVTFRDCYPTLASKELSSMETIHFDITNEIGGDAKPFDNTPCVNVVVNNCVFDQVVGGAGCHHDDEGDSFNKNFTITNNKFYGLKGVGITCSLLDGGYFYNNVAEDCSASFVYGTSVRSVTIEKNTVKNSAVGIGMKSGVYGTKDIKILNNEFMNNSREAIWIAAEGTSTDGNLSDSLIRIEDNKIRDVKYYGIFTEGFNVSIKNNEIEGVTYGAPIDSYKEANVSMIRAGHSESAEIVGNTMSGSTSCISCFEVQKADIHNNTISDISGNGIYLYGGGHTIADNTVDSGSTGIFLQYAPSKSSVSKIVGNTVSNTKHEGISAFAEDKYVSSAAAEKAFVTIQDNTVTNANNYGIQVRGYNTEISNNYLKGIGYNPDGSTVEKKNVSGIRVNGVYSSGKITGNTVIDTTIGFSVAHSKNIELFDNSVKYASRYGIQVGSVDSENITVDSNSAILSGGRDNGTSDSSAFNANGLTGLYCKNNNFYGNGVYDIAVWDVKGDVIVDNNILNGLESSRIGKNVKIEGTNLNANVRKISSSPISMEPGEKMILLTDVEDVDRTVEWSSSDTSIVSVDSCGVINAITPGKAEITMKSGNSVVKTTVTVSEEKKNYDVSVSYTTHVQRIGWQKNVKDGVMAGTSGQSLRLEAIQIKLETERDLNIEYTTHVQNYGWLPWVSNGEDSGTSGESKRLEAIEIRLTGEDADLYDVYYRVHAQKFGWLGWAKNGEASGTAGFSYRLEGIQIVVQLKTKGVPKDVEGIYSWHDYSYSAMVNGVQQNMNGKVVFTTGNPKSIAYSTHVQGIGWQSMKFNGQMSGTKGQSRRLEGIKISLIDPKYQGGIEYKTYVQGIGWMDTVRDGQMSGTSGRSLRLEAIQIRLTGEMSEKYDVYYRVQSQTYGWMGWAKNGEDAGTVGPSKRLEAIQILLVKKGGSKPADNWGGYMATFKDPCKYQ